MGATDEEMAILQNFGSNSSQGGQDGTNENRLDLIDLDCRQDANCDQVNKLLLYILSQVYDLQIFLVIGKNGPSSQWHRIEFQM